jgi:purine-binding chemotaxis protein CheW
MIGGSDARSGKMDWQARKERMARAQAALAAAEQLSEEQAKAVMDQRALALAEVPEQPPDTAQILEVMTFRLANEKMSIETRYVRGVQHPGEITPLPGSPPFLIGVTNLRGGVLAVMDLREFFGIPAAEDDSRSRIVIVGQGQPEFGMLADEVYEIVRLHIADLLDPPGSVSGMGRDCLRGVTKDALLVLDGAALLTDERLYVDEGG